MRLIALNGLTGSAAPWRGAFVLRGAGEGPGVLLDPTAALAARLEAEPALRRRAGLDGPARPVLLSSARLEQAAALLGLRHGAPIDLYATPAVFENLTCTLPVLPQLERHCRVHWRMVPVAGDQLTGRFPIHGQAGLRGIAVAGATDRGADDDKPPAEALAIAVDDGPSRRRVVWLCRRHRIAAATERLLDGADVVVAQDDGPCGPLVDWLARLPVPHKLLAGGGGDDDAPLARRGITRARDGMELAL